ncbi:DUF2911 domain-containing protein [Spirosoma aureum]|nr:DUF2911 domain-containing protein [Spirosoma aureum]
MRTKHISRVITLTLAGVLMTMMTWAQGDKANRPSPPATASGKIKDATITINYSSPSVKGRQVWDPSGTLAPYGKVWRAGANEATIFETDKDIKVEGKTLPAGKYSLFAIPDQKEWKIIFNSQTGQWGIKRGGEANRDPANDVLTVSVKPATAPMTERLVYNVTGKGVVLKWETVEVPIAIQ